MGDTVIANTQLYLDLRSHTTKEWEIAYSSFNETHAVIALRWHILIYAWIADILYHFITMKMKNKWKFALL